MERCPSDYDFDKVSAEHLHGLLTNLFLDFIADDRQVQQQLSELVVHLRENVLLENLFHTRSKPSAANSSAYLITFA